MNIRLDVIALAATLLIVLFLWIRMADAGARVSTPVASYVEYSTLSSAGVIPRREKLPIF